MSKSTSQKVTLDELKGMYKQYGKTRYIPKVVKDKFRKHGLAAYAGRPIYQRRAEKFIKELKSEGYLKNVGGTRTARQIYRGIIRRRRQQEVAAVKQALKEKKLKEKISQKSSSKKSALKEKKSKELAAARRLQELVEEQEKKKKTKSGLPFLGLEYLPSKVGRSNFLKYLEKISSNKMVVLRAKNIIKELNLDKQEELTERQLALILRKLQQEGLIGLRTTSEPIGQKIAKKESLRKAYVAMGIAEEQAGRYIPRQEKLPAGVKRTVAQKAETSIFRILEPKAKEKLEPASPEEVISPTSAAGEARKKKLPTTSISRVGHGGKKKKKEGELPDILAE